MALLGRKLFAILTRTVLQWGRSCATVAFCTISSSNRGTGFPWCFGGSAWSESCIAWILKAKSMFPVDLFLPTIHLSCTFPLGVRKYLYTDATKKNKNKGRKDIREGGRRGKEEQREEQREDKPHQRTGFCHMLPCSVGCLAEFMIYWPMEFWEMVSVLLQLYKWEIGLI